MSKHLTIIPGKELGGRATLAVIQQAIAEDSDYEDMSKEEKETAITELAAFRMKNTSAARTTNRSAARDVDSTMKNVQREVFSFHFTSSLYS